MSFNQSSILIFLIKFLAIECQFGQQRICVCASGFIFCVGPVHFSQDLHVRILAIFFLILDFTVLFTHLNLFCYSIFSFQFLVFRNKRYPNRPRVSIEVDYVNNLTCSTFFFSLKKNLQYQIELRSASMLCMPKLLLLKQKKIWQIIKTIQNK